MAIQLWKKISGVIGAAVLTAAVLAPVAEADAAPWRGRGGGYAGVRGGGGRFGGGGFGHGGPRFAAPRYGFAGGPRYYGGGGYYGRRSYGNFVGPAVLGGLLLGGLAATSYYGAYAGPYDDDCYLTRRRVWNGWTYVVRRVRVCD